jgi:hypothetical protein
LTPGEATLLAEPGFDLGKFTALSDEVVLGSFEKAESAYAVNGFGDQLIVTRVKLRVESAWKGKLAPRETVELEFPGGTVDGVTFVVHDGPTPTVPPEGRAVVFLARGAMGASVFGGSEGLLRVDTEGRVAGTELDVATLEKRIRAVAAGQVKR